MPWLSITSDRRSLTIDRSSGWSASNAAYQYGHLLPVTDVAHALAPRFLPFAPISLAAFCRSNDSRPTSGTPAVRVGPQGRALLGTEFRAQHGQGSAH